MAKTHTIHRPPSAADQAALNERVHVTEESVEKPAVSVEHASAGGYSGPERRMASLDNWTGTERRKLL